MLKLNPTAIHAPAGQYTHSCRVSTGSDLVFIAGQAGIDKDGKVVDGVEAQMRQTWDNIIAILTDHGLTTDDLVYVNYYLVDPADVETWRRVRRDYLPEAPPSATALIVSALVFPEWHYEMDAVAAVPST